MRICSHCKGPVEPNRTVCATCRSTLKFKATRGSGIARTVTVFGTMPKLPVIPPVPAPKVGQPPCIICGASWSAMRGDVKVYSESVCHSCAISLPQVELLRRVEQAHKAAVASGQPRCKICHGHGGPICARCRGRLATGGMVASSAGPFQFYSPSHIPPGGPIGTMSIAPPGGIMAWGTRPSSVPSPPPGPPQPLEQVDKDRAPDLIEPVLAWRGWNVTPDGHLVAAATDGIWDRGPNHAVCRSGTAHTDVPAVTCDCGFYGWHETKNIAHGQIWGGIRCWGEIIVHDCGIRAEHAEIVVLIEHEPMETELLARIVDRYQVPVVKTQAEAEKIAASKGIRVPAEMRPDPADALAEMGAKIASVGGLTLAQAAANLNAAFGVQAAAAGKAATQFGKALNAAAQSIAVRKPTPIPPVKLAVGMLCTVVLVILHALLISGLPVPRWEGYWAGAMIGVVGYFSPLPAVLWRFGRAVRCFWHNGHQGLWRHPPEGVPRSGATPEWSRALNYGERCVYCWRRRQ